MCLKSSAVTSIYSVIIFIINQEKELQSPTPVIIFDQPFWLKAREIVHAKFFKVILMLRGFYLIMIFLDNIGNVMTGSGISDSLKLIYGSNTIQYILSRKVVFRALQGYVLIKSSLKTKLRKYFIREKDTNDTDNDNIEGNENQCAIENEDN